MAGQAVAARHGVRRLVPSELRRWAYPKLAPSRAFVDLGRGCAATLLVAGSQRGGTTWLASLATEAFHCRLVFEPLRREHIAAAAPCSFNRYVAPGEDAPELERYVRLALSGRVRSFWSDRWNTTRVSSHRVVKEIGQNLLLPWIAEAFPEVPIVLVLRHPLASAASAVALGWDARLEETLDQPALLAGPLAPFADAVDGHRRSADPLARHVLRWCVETAVPATMLDPSRVLVVFFEDLERDPAGEMARLDRHLERASTRRWRARPLDDAALRRPSFTDWRGTAGATRTAGTTGDERVRAVLAQRGPGGDEAMALIRAFGLERLYGAGPGPLVGPDDALGALSGRAPSVS